eukprot:756427-Hanusia_phi.AAC.3
MKGDIKVAQENVIRSGEDTSFKRKEKIEGVKETRENEIENLISGALESSQNTTAISGQDTIINTSEDVIENVALLSGSLGASKNDSDGNSETSFLTNDYWQSIQTPIASHAVGATLAHELSFEGNEAALHNIISTHPFLIESKTIDGETPAHHAAAGGQSRILYLLANLSKTILLEADYDGWTPAHMAAFYEQPDTISVLKILAPESFKLKDKNGRLPIDLTNNQKCLQLMKTIEKPKPIVVAEEAAEKETAPSNVEEAAAPVVIEQVEATPSAEEEQAAQAITEKPTAAPAVAEQEEKATEAEKAVPAAKLQPSLQAEKRAATEVTEQIKPAVATREEKEKGNNVAQVIKPSAAKPVNTLGAPEEVAAPAPEAAAPAAPEE